MYFTLLMIICELVPMSDNNNWTYCTAHFALSCYLQLKFMWGNLAVGSGDRWREVSVPFLQPGQERGSVPVKVTCTAILLVDSLYH